MASAKLLRLINPERLEAVVSAPALEAALSTFGIEVSDDPSAVSFSYGEPHDGLSLAPSWHHGHFRLAEMHARQDLRLQRLFREFGAGLDEQTIHAAACALRDGSGREVLQGMLPEGTAPEDRDLVRRYLAVDLLFNAAMAKPEALAALIADGHAPLSSKPARVSIIINNFNYAEYLADAIESALGQDVPAHEVIVVDDGSTDASKDVIARYGHVVPVFKENGGQGSTFNAGFAKATGDLILFLDADDRLSPQAVRVLQAQPLDGVSRISFGLETIDANGNPTGLLQMSRTARSGALKGPLLAEGSLISMPTSGNAFPRSVLERLLPLPEDQWRISADVYLCFGAALLGDCRHLPQVFGSYRIHGNNTYFTTLASEAPYAARRDRQRKQAFGDLSGKLNDLLEPDEIERMAALAGSDPISTEAGQIPVSQDDLRPGLLQRPVFGSNPAGFGGPSAWPILAPGATVDLTMRPQSSPIGMGWVWQPDGVVPDGPNSTIALRVAGPRADWAVNLAFQNANTRCTPWINGVKHDPILLNQNGVASLLVDGSLLELDYQTRTWRIGIALTFEGSNVPVVTALGVQRLLPSGAAAPVLHPDQELVPQDNIGTRILADGWEWPTAIGARMSAPLAKLRLSIAEPVDHVLSLRFDAPPMMVTLDNAAAEAHAEAGCLQIELGADRIARSELIELALIAADHAPRPTLQSVALRQGKLTRTSGPQRLNPAELHAWTEEPGNWQNADGDALWLTAERGEFRLSPPGDAGHVCLTLLTLPGTGQRLRVWTGGHLVETSGVEAAEQVILPLPEDRAPGEAVILRLETTALVDSDLLGLGDSALLGGAVVDLAFLDDAAQSGPV